MTKGVLKMAKPAVALALFFWGQVAGAETITVSAAASLADAFKQIAVRFEADHPGATVQLNVAASGTLLRQIEKGAPVDVFASADELTMDQAEEHHLVVTDSRTTFARNVLVLIQPRSAEHTLSSLEALRDDVAVRRIAIGNPDSVPVGRYTKLALEAAGHWRVLQAKLIPAQSARQALEYVARGEVDAGFVYRTDAALVQDKVKVSQTVAAPPISYPIAVLRHGQDKAAARRFVEFVLSADGQAVLEGFGFKPANQEGASSGE